MVDVVVEKSNGDGTYTELDSYVAGLDMTSVESVQGVSSITELRSIMPSENMVVQVNGYYTAGDSPTRKYLWVSGAANTDDGGYVIRSNRDYNGGRWVMLWDDPEFLPVSLYGIMCGYSGSSKTSSIPALEALGNYVLVGSVRVEVPPVILFDWRMAQPTSGQLSPVAYHWSRTFTTTHYVACARGVVFSTSSTPPTIHCAGVRGESYANAYWMVDQDYTTKDPAEKISTLMFRGNTLAVHDAFMACVACPKVKVVELSKDGSGTTVYNLLTSSDNFNGKVVVDYVEDKKSDVQYVANFILFASNGSSYITRLQGDYFETRLLSAYSGTLKKLIFTNPVNPGSSEDVISVHNGTNVSFLSFNIFNYTAGEIVCVINYTGNNVTVSYRNVDGQSGTASISSYTARMFICVFADENRTHWVPFN